MKRRAALLASALALCVTPGIAPAFTYSVNYIDGASSGFNDPTVVAPVGGNSGTTLGAQRKQAFEFALARWGERLQSSIGVVVHARWQSQACSNFSGTLGQAGPQLVASPSPPSPLQANIFYPLALARALTGSNSIASGTHDIDATFNLQVDASATCLGGKKFYYGLDQNPGSKIDFLNVAIHELGHGLGFVSLLEGDGTSSASSGLFSIFDYSLYDETTSMFLPAENNSQRAAVIISDGNLTFNDTNTNGGNSFLNAGSRTNGHQRMFAPTTFQNGSSVSHWDDGATPDLVMEPSYAEIDGAQHVDLTTCAFADLGWALSAPFACPDIAGSSNTAPTISDIANQSINEDAATGSLAFTIDDAETAEASLTVTRSSSNTTLVPLANVVLGGSGANRTVTVTPAANTSGTATITVTVSDGTLTDVDTFTVTVASVNDAPTLNAIANRSISENAAQQSVSLGGITAGPNESQMLNVTASSSDTGLIPNPSVNYTSASSTGSIQFTPVADQTGTATITVTVTDNGGTANGGVSSLSRTFTVTVNEVGNTAPTSTQIGNQSIAQNASTGALAFTVGDAETSPGSLTVSGSSSNTTLVPNANIVFGGSGASRTVTVTPAAGQSGSATISYSVSDGSATTSRNFTVTVGGNTAPTSTQIGNQSIAQNASTGALAFTVGDAETSAGSLSVSGTSSNTTLVPNASIVFGGSGANRTVTVTPAVGQSGSATISYSVSDGTATTSRNFTLTVTAPGGNTPPTLTQIGNQDLSEDGATGAIAFTVGDAQTTAADLEVSGTSNNTDLVPNASILFGGSGANRTISVTPAANQSGSATITYAVTDGDATTTRQFTVVVASVNDGPSLGSIVNQTVNAGASTGALSFTVSDPETSAGSLSVSGSSSNTTLVPNANIAFGGSGGNRTITVTPAAGQSGSATITYLVSDGALTASRTFVLTVNAAPPPDGGDEGGGGGGGSFGLFTLAVLASFALLVAARRRRQRVKSAQTAVSR